MSSTPVQPPQPTSPVGGAPTHDTPSPHPHPHPHPHDSDRDNDGDRDSDDDSMQATDENPRPTDENPQHGVESAPSSGLWGRVPPPVRRFATRPMLRSVLAGLLIAGSLPPWGWWPLAFIGIALLDRLLADAPANARFLRGTVVGLALFVPTVVWITQLTVPGYLVAVLVFSAIVGIFCMVVPPRAGRALGLIGAWMLLESFRSAWPFGGVPLSLLAVGQVGGPLAGIARIGGVLAIGGVTVALGVALSSAAAKQWTRTAGLVGASLAVVLVAQLAPTGHDNGTAIDVAFVQGGGPQGTRAINTDRRKVFERHLAASEDVPAGMDLVLWPENVVDTDGDVQEATEGTELQALARRLGAPLSVGTVEGVSETAFRNSQQVVDPDGTWSDRYVKVQRVPFGEWVPFRSLIEQVAPDTLARRDATVSHQAGLLRTDAAPLATAISWEVFFGHRVRSGVQAGGELIYNPTNGSTYTGTFVQTQQVASSRLRAIENGRWLVQVSPTGFSAFIGPDGTVHQRTATREQAVRVMRDLPLRSGFTWYTRWGDTPSRMIALGLLIAAWVVALMHHRRRNVPAPHRG